MRYDSLWVLCAARQGWGRVGFHAGCECVAFHQFPALHFDSPCFLGVPLFGRLFGRLDCDGVVGPYHGFVFVVARGLYSRLQPLWQRLFAERVG